MSLRSIQRRVEAARRRRRASPEHCQRCGKTWVGMIPASFAQVLLVGGDDPDVCEASAVLCGPCLALEPFLELSREATLKRCGRCGVEFPNFAASVMSRHPTDRNLVAIHAMLCRGCLLAAGLGPVEA